MGEQWLIFRHEGRELCSYTLRGTFEGEKQATIEMLAHENGIPAKEITCTVEIRGTGSRLKSNSTNIE